MPSENRNSSEMESFELPAGVQAMFASYREAMPDPDAGANFMPQLWTRIDSQRNFTFKLGRFAKGFVSVALASCLAMSLLFLNSGGPISPVYGETYLDALADADSGDVDLTRSIEAL